MKFLIYILMVVILISYVNAQGLGQCPLGNYPLGDCTIGEPSKKEGGGGGGGGAIIVPPTFTEINLFGIEPDFIDNQPSCKEGYQLFDNRCYPCPENGYLKFNPDDRSVLCVICTEGFKLEGNECIQEIQPPYMRFIDVISGIFKGKNLLISYVILISGVLISGYYGVKWLRKKEKEEKKEDDESES